MCSTSASNNHVNIIIIPTKFTIVVLSEEIVAVVITTITQKFLYDNTCK